MSCQTEHSITHIWSRFNTRWLCMGALAGILAGTIMIGIACVIASKTLGEWSQPFKLLGTFFYGKESTAFGPLGRAGFAGALLHYALCLFYGLTFAQLMDENSKTLSLVILGGVTAFIIWIFGGMLFTPTISYNLKSMVPTGTSLFLHLLFGISFGIIIATLRPRS